MMQCRGEHWVLATFKRATHGVRHYAQQCQTTHSTCLSHMLQRDRTVHAHRSTVVWFSLDFSPSQAPCVLQAHQSICVHGGLKLLGVFYLLLAPLQDVSWRSRTLVATPVLFILTQVLPLYYISRALSHRYKLPPPPQKKAVTWVLSSFLDYFLVKGDVTCYTCAEISVLIQAGWARGRGTDIQMNITSGRWRRRTIIWPLNALLHQNSVTWEFVAQVSQKVFTRQNRKRL